MVGFNLKKMTTKNPISNHFENDCSIIQYDHQNSVLLFRWKLEPASEEFKQAMHEVIAALRHFKTSKVVWDTVRLGCVLFDDQKWIANVWLKQAIEAGYAQAAFVVPEDVFTKMSVEDTVEMGTAITAGVRQTKYFDDMKNALEWICGQ
ncbi:hypothetical protein GCM10009122_60320 [Fulvivirga kasyanovii]